MALHDIVVIGASAGAVEALRQITSRLPPDLPAAVFVVVHVPATFPSRLPEILARAGALPVSHARDGEVFQRGRIYVAPPGRHLVIEGGTTRLTLGPRENRVRPAVDTLFRSAALAHGPRVVGVVLTGGLDDGTAGLWAIKERGGIAVVQDPADAQAPGMPASALANVDVDHRVPLREMAQTIVQLVRTSVREDRIGSVSEIMDIENRIALDEGGLEAGVLKLGTPSPLTCPECHGVLLERKEGGMARFRCHTGHAFALGTLFAEVNDAIEASLWSALRAIDEHVMLMQRGLAHLVAQGEEIEAGRLRRRIALTLQRAASVREVAMQHSESTAAGPERADAEE
jgi:two-component system chemotaxis response regulator CheB